MTEYNTPLTPAQQEISELLQAVSDSVSSLRDLSAALHRVGLHAAAAETSQTASRLGTVYAPVTTRFIKGEI